MLRLFLLSLLLFSTIPKSHCQSDKDVYEVLTTLVDTLTSNMLKDFRGYPELYKPVPITDSSITLFDPETFEELTYSKEKYNSKILPLYLKKYNKELQKKELIHKIKFPVIFLFSFKKKYLNSLKIKNFNYPLVDTVLSKTNPKPLHIQIKRIKTKKKFTFKRATKKNIEKYKYVNIGFIQISKPIFSTAKTESLMFLGICYYTNPNQGPSWNEGLTYLKKINSKWFLSKTR